MRPDVERRIREGLRAAILATGRVEHLDLSAVHLEKPRDPVHGDLATNAAMVLAALVKASPRMLAEEIVARLDFPPDLIGGVEIAGPGFINLRWSDEFLFRETERIVRAGSEYGLGEKKAGKRIQLEFVSANPTGPLNVVSARAAAVGDSLARILEWAGWEVETEFYVNDGGTQIQLFGDSIRARFLELGGFPSSLPEDGYRGEWVRGIARMLWDLLSEILRTAREDLPLEPWRDLTGGRDIGDTWEGGTTRERAAALADALCDHVEQRNGARGLAEGWFAPRGGGDALAGDPGRVSDEEVLALGEPWGETFPFGRVGVAFMLAWQRASFERFGVIYNADACAESELRGWFHESRLYETRAVEDTLANLKTLGDAVYEKDGAWWLATSGHGDDEDRVLVRSDGRPTYFLTDIAYHENKLRRGYDSVIDIWGPDHHGHVGRMKAAMQIVGAGRDWLEVIIAQQVNVLRDGKPVRMSKRGGEIISLDEVVAEAGVDTARFFFLMRKTSSHLDFDLDLARKASEENPVYYVQYAFARIWSIYEFARRRNLMTEEMGDLSLLTAREEVRLMRDLVRFPGEVRAAAGTLEPHRLTVYLQDLAHSFHKFYQGHRVVGDDDGLSRARLSIVHATRAILETGMGLVGVQPPKERM
ncbi:MAG: arginine--tRNA ligase [Candidatus Eisenbacteria sp.]|nr:arginine--tRNA ligase [Candidatus Eisenbacteria bacterium]